VGREVATLDHFDVSLVLTHACNLACSYCYMGEHHAASMTRAIAFGAVDAALARAAHVQVSFFGGEPMLAWELLVACAERARQRGAADQKNVVLQMTTNGTLITRERAARLADLGIHVAVSLDGMAIAHDAGRPDKRGASSYEAVVEGIARLREAAVPFEIIAVVSPENVAHLARSIEHIAALGPRGISMNPAFERAWSDEAVATWGRELTRTAEFFAASWRSGKRVAIRGFDSKLASAAAGGRDPSSHCSVGRWNVAVAPSGNLYPCDRLVADDRSSRFVIGTLRGDVFDLHPDTKLPARGPSDPACEGCEERYRCGASCACANIAETGEPHMPGGVQCWYEQTLAKLADEVGWALLREGEPHFLEVAYGIKRAPAPYERDTLRRLPTVKE
jgi:uncharacterized protein